MSILTITNNNFETEVVKSEEAVLLDFWAPWCGPCRMLSPVVDELAKEVSQVKFGKVNIDEEAELAKAFKVMSIPTLAVMKNGKVVSTLIGYHPKAEIEKMLKNASE